MKQVVHIFLKDARFLRIEICVFIVVAAVFAGAADRVLAPEILLEAAAIYLIARVVHAEPIPGDRQFWLTRPYSRMSLAGAKLLFIAVFVCLPVAAAQIAMLVAGGFPLPASIPGLLWSQALLFTESILIAGIASVTSGAVILMLAILLLGAAVMMTQLFYPGPVSTYLPLRPAAPDWIRQYSALAILAFTAALVLVRQYRDRATTFSRISGIIGIALAIGLFLRIPASAVLAAQSWFSGPPAGTPLDVSIEPALKGRGVWVSGGGARDPLYRRFRIPLPITVKGLADGTEARVDALGISFAWPDNRNWTPDVAPGVNPRQGTPGVSIAEATVLMDSDLYEVNRDSPLTLSGAAYVTLFGGTATRTAAIGNRPVNFQDGLQCSVAEFNFLLCRSFFRWPARLVYAESAGAQFEFRNSQISYSPFPAGTSLNSMETRSGGELRSRELTVTTKRPLAHFWRSFRVDRIRLSDFEGPEPPPSRTQ